jgi:hypothetical protein
VWLTASRCWRCWVSTRGRCVAHRVALFALLGEPTRSLCGSPRRAALEGAGDFAATARA